MKNRLICGIMTIVFILMQMTAVIAEETLLDVKFTSQSEKLDGWKLPDGYSVTDDGIIAESKDSFLMYEGAEFKDKYEFSFEFKLPYVSTANVMFNYRDTKNYQMIAIYPQEKKAVLQNMKDGYAKRIDEQPSELEFKATQWYKIRIISNGGKCVSAYVSDGKTEYTLFDNSYCESGIESGFVGFNSVSNTLALKNFKVVGLWAADAVKPPEPTSKPDSDTVLKTKEPVEGMYDDKLLDFVISLGLISDKYRANGWNYLTETEYAEVMKRLGVNADKGDKNVSLSKGYNDIIKALGYSSALKDYYKTDIINRLRKGAKIKDSDYMTYHDLARLLYNSLEEEVLIADGTESGYIKYNTYKNRTLLTEVLNMDYTEGQCTDNSISSLTGGSALADNLILIDGVVMKYDTDLKTLYDLLGRYVKVYYRKLDDVHRYNEVLWVENDKRETVLTVNAEDFSDYSDYTIRYTEKNKKKKQSFKRAAPLVYNGKAVKNYDKSIFDIKNGEIKLIGCGSEYDTVLITEYEDFVIDSVNAQTQKIYSKVNYRYNKEKTYELSIPDDVRWEISSESGKLKIEDLKANDILSVIKNEELIIIALSRKIIANFEIKEVEKNDGVITVRGNDSEAKINEYEISSYCSDSGMVKEFTPGMTVDLYVNVFGRGVWAVQTANQAMLTGCLARVYTDEVGENLTLCVFQTDGVRKKYQTADKVSLLDSSGERKNVKESELYNILKNKNEIITYLLNDNDEIVYIELPGDGYLPMRANSISKLADDEMKFKIGESFAGKYFFNDGGISFFAVNESEKDNLDKYFIANTWSLANSSTYKVKIYGTDNDMFAKYAILYNMYTNAFPSNSSKTAVVTGMTTGIYDDEVCTFINAYNGTDITLYADSEVVENAADPFSYAKDETFKKRGLNKGDIIRYTTDPTTKKVTKIIVIYSRTENNPISGEKGWIVGSDGVKSGDTVRTNPYCFQVNNDYLSFRKNEYLADFDSYSQFRVTYGSVVRFVNGVMELTTEDLSLRNGDYAPLNEDDYYVFRKKFSSDSSIMINANKVNENVNVTSAKQADIQSYETAGNTCTKFLYIQNNYNSVMFFINQDN